MSGTEPARYGYGDATAFLTLKDKNLTAVLDSDSAIALFGLASEAVATEGFDNSFTLTILHAVLGRMPDEGDFDRPLEDPKLGVIEFSGESGVEHAVRVTAFHTDGDEITLAQVADVLLAITAPHIMANILERIRESGDLTEADIVSELGGRLVEDQK